MGLSIGAPSRPLTFDFETFDLGEDERGRRPVFVYDFNVQRLQRLTILSKKPPFVKKDAVLAS
jgi:hypothetical protein